MPGERQSAPIPHPRPAATAAAGRRRRAAALAAAGLYLAVGLIGAAGTFYPTLHSRFARLQSDPGDPLFNNYLLEHELQLLRRPGYHGELWSPPFFHPARDVLAYSDNLLGMFPFYALLRLGAAPILAYQLLAIFFCLLTYAAMVVLLRGLGVSAPLAALGGYVFAFGMALLSHLGHIQMLADFYAPLALLVLLRLAAAPSAARLALLALLLYLQLLTAIYLGWFLLLGMALFVPLLLAFDGAARRRLGAFCRRSWLAVSATALVWLLSCYATFHPYLRVARHVGYRSWETVLLFLPALRSWVAVSAGSPYGRWLHLPPEAFASWERSLFPGFVLVLLAPLALRELAHLKQGSGERPWERERERERLALLLACGCAALGLIVLSLGLPRLELHGLRLVRAYPGVSLWRLVYLFVPGAAAIRAVGRVFTMVYLFGMVAVLAGADAALRRWRRRAGADRWAARAAAALPLLLLATGIAEQHVSGLPSTPKAAFSAQVERIRSRIDPSCKSAFVTVPEEGFPLLTTELAAMWAGLAANVPVVNGYSGNAPPGYPDLRATRWRQHLARWAGDRVCVVSGE